MSEPFPPIYVVSGGTGASAEQVVYTVLAQFPDSSVPVITIPRVRELWQVADVVARAADCGAAIVHTMVDGELRQALIRQAEEQGVTAIDLMGPLIDRLAAALGQTPVAHPGLYRHLHQAYFDRVAAIEFALAHDDGRHPQGWPQAEIVLVGVSRVGKTPLSMYLSVLGWKVANVPLVPGVPTPRSLFDLDHRRVIGLDIEPELLVYHRQERQRRIGAHGTGTPVAGTTGPGAPRTGAPILGAPILGAYADPAAIRRELERARGVFEQGAFSVVDVTDKPIEASADRVVELVTHRMVEDARKR